jgi:hypothetical protein
MATHPLAQGIAQLGRGNDSMLMHVTPNEVAGLQAVAKSMGGEITYNPHTGLPEAGFFDAISSFLPMLAGAALAPATGGASLGLTGLSATAAPIIAGAATGAILAGAKGQDPLMGGLTGGLGGYGGGSLAGTFSKMGSGAAATATTPVAQGQMADQASNMLKATVPEVGANMSATNIAPYTGTLDAAGKVAGPNMAFNPATAGGVQLNNTASTAGIENQLLSGTGTGGIAGGNTVDALAASTNPTFGQGLSNVGQGIKQLASEGGYDAFKAAGGTGMDLAMPLGSVALAGMQPEPFNPGDKDKYDPYATLNLGGDSGLRLFAQGGVIDTPQSMMGLGGLYGTRDGTPLQNTPMEGYGYGGSVGYAQGGMLHGPGDGMSDSIPATIEGRQPARLADGEFVIPADVVSHLGNGSTKAGSQRLYSMLDKVRKARTGTKKQGKQINPNKYMP